eukprot:5459930-Prymnesium_polylepis.1
MQLTPSAGIGKGTIPFPSIGSVLLAFARAVAGYRVPPLAVLSDCEEHLTSANLGLCWRLCRRMKLG